MAGNAVAFAIRALQASHPGSTPEDFSSASVRGIAIAVATATCFIHTVSRRGGIILNNFFAIVKVSILILIIIVSIVVSAGGLRDSKTGEKVPNMIGDNADTSKSFLPINDVSSQANGFAQGFLAVGKSKPGFAPARRLTIADLCLQSLLFLASIRPTTYVSRIRPPPTPGARLVCRS